MARQRSYVVVVSDFRGPRDWRRSLLALSGRHHVVAIEIRDAREMELPKFGTLRLVDPETGRQLKVDTSSDAAARALRRGGRAGAPRGCLRDHLVRRAPRRAADARRLAARADRLPAPRGRDMSFASPIALWALVLVPIAAAAYIWFQRRRVRDASQFVSPALFPNVVDQVPGWRRHLPIALLLLAVAALLVGFARPHATLSERSEEATVVLAIDTSRSMGAKDVAPTGSPPRRRRRAASSRSCRRSTASPSSPSARSRRSCRRRPSTARSSTSAINDLRIGQGTALGDGLANAIQVATGVPPGKKPPPGTKPVPSAILVISGRRAGRRHRPAARGDPAGAQGEDPRLRRAARDARGHRQRAARRRLQRADPRADEPRRAAHVRDADGRQVLPGADAAGSERGLHGPQVAARPHEQGRGDHRSPSPRAGASCCSRAACSRRSGSGGSRDPRRLGSARRWPRRCSWVPPRARPRTSAGGCRSAFRSRARGSWSRRPAASPRRRAGSSPARGAWSAAWMRVRARRPSRSSSPAASAAP